MLAQTLDLNQIRWRLWEGNKLVLEINGSPAQCFTTVEYSPNSYPVTKRYRAFNFDSDQEILDAQLEHEGSRIFD